MYAVIRTGGKQYRVAQDDILEIERLPGETGDKIEFTDVLMVGGDEPQIGAPLVDGASVAGELVEQFRGQKIIIFKKKRRTTYRRKQGHRQNLSKVRITEILTGGAKPKKAAAKPKTEPAEAKPAAAEAAPAESGFNDDITLIGGVGPALEKKLAEQGITSLKQIAELTDEEIKRLDGELKLRGRIEREEWIDQANELIAGKPPRAKVDQKAADKAKK